MNYGYVWCVCLVVAMGGFLFGYDWVVIGGAKPFYEAFFGIDEPWLSGWTMSSALVGCIIGAAFVGVISDRYGRKRPLILSGFLYMISALGCALVSDLAWFNFFRILGGVGIGISSSLAPMFIAEMAPAESRGRLVTINQLTIVVGILAAQLINLAIAQPVPEGSTVPMILESWNGQLGWRWMVGMVSVPASLFFLLMFLVPESPRWLVKAGANARAENILKRVGGEAYARDEIREIEATFDREAQTKAPLRELCDKRYIPVLLLGIYLAVYQQWCGINIIFNYAADIFKEAGFGIDGMLLNIVITGVVNLVFTFVAIATVDRWGRRPLMLFGAAGLGVIYGIMGIFELKGIAMLTIVLAAIACYAMTLAPVVWVVISEIFPNRVRGTAMSLAVCFLWIGCAALTFTFPLLKENFGMTNTFGLYGMISLVSFFIIFFFLKETKGKSLEKIEQNFTGIESEHEA